MASSSIAMISGWMKLVALAGLHGDALEASHHSLVRLVGLVFGRLKERVDSQAFEDAFQFAFKSQALGDDGRPFRSISLETPQTQECASWLPRTPLPKPRHRRTGWTGPRCRRVRLPIEQAAFPAVDIDSSRGVAACAAVKSGLDGEPNQRAKTAAVRVRRRPPTWAKMRMIVAWTLPLHQGGAPRQPGAESHHEHAVAGSDSSGLHRFGQHQGNARRGRISVTV